MNERIRELVAQAREPLHNKDLPFNQGLMEYSETFAELILKECTDVLMQRHEESKHSHNYYHVTANMLKNHFGVEE